MDFLKHKQDFFNRLGETAYMVLATSLDDKPLASTMTCIMFDGAIWMQTDKKFPKYEQMLKNNKVALCINATNILGTAKFCGHPLDEKNEKFIELLKKHHPNSFKMYTGVDTQVLIKVTPTYVTDWLYEKGSNEIINLDLIKEKVEIQYYKNNA